MAPRTALLAGATGLVGRELLLQLGNSDSYASVNLLLRRPAPELQGMAKARSLLVDFAALPTLPAVDDAYIALGTTIKVAGSKQAFRRVDYDFVLNVARAAHEAGATRLGIVSALGADASSRVFYNRVKGELERDVSTLGYMSVVIAQPSLLLGDREAIGQPSRAGERIARQLLGPISRLIPAQVRPVAAADVARALLDAVLGAAPGVTKISSGDMHRR
jgi:uncharacterized protein YbjT (DUF2867 family)